MLREFGLVEWARALSSTQDAESAVLTAHGVSLRIQLLSRTGYPAWPTELRVLSQRYADAGPATLRVPTRPSFAAWKTVAWVDRAAPRDLWDLAALARIGGIDSDARALFVRYGPTAKPPASWMFDRAPSVKSWHAQLAGQTRLTIEPGQALAEVRSAWRVAHVSTAEAESIDLRQTDRPVPTGCEISRVGGPSRLRGDHSSAGWRQSGCHRLPGACGAR